MYTYILSVFRFTSVRWIEVSGLSMYSARNGARIFFRGEGAQVGKTKFFFKISIILMCFQGNFLHFFPFRGRGGQLPPLPPPWRHACTQHKLIFIHPDPNSSVIRNIFFIMNKSMWWWDWWVINKPHRFECYVNGFFHLLNQQRWCQPRLIVPGRSLPHRNWHQAENGKWVFLSEYLITEGYHQTSPKAPAVKKVKRWFKLIVIVKNIRSDYREFYLIILPIESS